MYVCVCVCSLCVRRALVRHKNLTNPDMRTHTHTNGRRVKVGDSDVLCFRRSKKLSVRRYPGKGAASDQTGFAIRGFDNDVSRI